MPTMTRKFSAIFYVLANIFLGIIYLLTKLTLKLILFAKILVTHASLFCNNFGKSDKCSVNLLLPFQHKWIWWMWNLVFNKIRFYQKDSLNSTEIIVKKLLSNVYFWPVIKSRMKRKTLVVLRSQNYNLNCSEIIGLKNEHERRQWWKKYQAPSNKAQSCSPRRNQINRLI